MKQLVCYIFSLKSFLLKKGPHNNVLVEVTDSTTTFYPGCFIASSQNPSEKLHSGKYDVATYCDKVSNLSEKDLSDFMKNVYVPSKDFISKT